MKPQDIEDHIDGKLALLMIDNYEMGATKPMTRAELANAIGMSDQELSYLERDIKAKARLNPSAWEAITLLYRTPTVIE